jgi:hypothetical protein
VSLACASLGQSGCSGNANADADAVVVEQGILGGRETAPCEWPAVVNLGGCSGVLVHPRVVVYAAHCGIPIGEVRFGTHASEPTLTVRTRFCRGIGGATLGDGTDLAACVLSEPVQGIEPARIMAGCEVDALREGQAVTLVGFGDESPNGTFGTQRVGVSRIEAIGDDILLNSSGVDTCHGDSGGPLFMDYLASDGTVTPRVIGITSAGTEQDCGTGLSHYVNLTRKLGWLEEVTGVDVTPCFNGDTWSPTPGCTAVAPRTRDSVDVTGAGGARSEVTLGVGSEGNSPTTDVPPRCEAMDPPVLLSTCGDPWGGPPDRKRPNLSVTSPSKPIEKVLAPDQDYLELKLSADASDDGWGVRGVTFTLRGEDGELEFDRVDEVPPYEIPVFRLPPGRFTLAVSAHDHAGNATHKTIPIQVSHAVVTGNDEGCRTVPGRSPTRPQGLGSLLLLAWVVLSIRRVPLLRRAAVGRAAFRPTVGTSV